MFEHLKKKLIHLEAQRGVGCHRRVGCHSWALGLNRRLGNCRASCLLPKSALPATLVPLRLASLMALVPSRTRTTLSQRT